MKDRKQHMTMKDIAEVFGISTATVSRALNNNKSISEKRREEIQKYAEEHNFLPNAIAESLRNNKVAPTKIIGVIVPQFVHYYFSTILSGIEKEAEINGYRIMVAQSEELYKKEVEICRSFARMHVCGVIVSQAKDTVNYDHFTKMTNSGIPLVFYDRICTGLNTSRVVVDDYQGAYNAVSYMIKRGCKNIAFFSGPKNLEISKNRYNGYRDALLKHGIKPDENLLFVCDNETNAEAIMPHVLNSSHRPDALFAMNDETAIGVMRATINLGLKIPNDLSVCGFTNTFLSKVSGLTTVEQRGEQVGREAVRILIRHVEGIIPDGQIEKRVVGTKLIVRNTTI